MGNGVLQKESLGFFKKKRLARDVFAKIGGYVAEDGSVSFTNLIGFDWTIASVSKYLMGNQNDSIPYELGCRNGQSPGITLHRFSVNQEPAIP